MYDGADSCSGASGGDVVCASGCDADSSESGAAVSSAYGAADWYESADADSVCYVADCDSGVLAEAYEVCAVSGKGSSEMAE